MNTYSSFSRRPSGKWVRCLEGQRRFDVFSKRTALTSILFHISGSIHEASLHHIRGRGDTGRCEAGYARGGHLGIRLRRESDMQHEYITLISIANKSYLELISLKMTRVHGRRSLHPRSGPNGSSPHHMCPIPQR